MLHQVTLYKLKPEADPAQIEEMMMDTRMQLLKIPEILSVKCGKNVDVASPWPFFIALDFESVEKISVTEDDAIYLKFLADVIKPNTIEQLALSYEMDPAKGAKS